jgi:hypothetical protein
LPPEEEGNVDISCVFDLSIKNTLSSVRNSSRHSMGPEQVKQCTYTCTCKHCATTKIDGALRRRKNKKHGAFVQGQILYVPLHAPNMDPKLSLNNPELNLSSAGPVFSKCRFVIVLRKFHKQMECLPIYTHGGKGVERKPKYELKEWTHVQDANRSSSKDTSMSLFASLDRGSVNQNAYIYITESVIVEYAGDIQDRGRMEQSSFDRLHELRAELDEKAQQEVWAAHRPGKSS